MLVHYRKEFCNYNFFLSTLVGLNRGLDHVRAVGTDGELALVDAVKHVRCFRHLQNNIERHLQENHFPSNIIAAYERDIFGWTDHEKQYHEGLVDSQSGVAFERQLAAPKPIWAEREAEAFTSLKSHSPKFFEWFVRHKANDMKEWTLRSFREEVGLGITTCSILH